MSIKKTPNLKKSSVFLYYIITAISFILPSALAAKGSLTFYHGVKPANKVTFAKTTSTKIENSMAFTGTIKITASSSVSPGTYYLYTSQSTGYNKSSWFYDMIVGKSKGTSSFGYYVDGTRSHTSTAPWAFDFR